MLPVNIAQCHQIHLNGVRCGSPALRGQSHCYYHSVLRQKREVPTIPYLDDALSVQFSLREIIQGVASGKWDTKRAALLLYALQIASSNLKRIEGELRLAKCDAITEVPAESYVNAPEKKAGAPRSRTNKKRPARTSHRSAKAAKKPAAPASDSITQSPNDSISTPKPSASASFPNMFMPGAQSAHTNGSA